MGNFITCFSFWKARTKLYGPDLEKHLAESPKGTQLRFAFSQALAVSYFGWMYGINNSPFVARYAEWLKQYISNLESYEFDGIYATMFLYLKAIPESWYGDRWTDLPIKEVKMFLIDTVPVDDWYPQCVGTESLIPYLMARNAAPQEGYATYSGRVALIKFIFDLPSRIIRIQENVVGCGFTACPYESVGKNDTDIKALATLPPIAGFLQRCDFGEGRYFECILSDMASLSLDNDPYRERSGSDRLFYASYTVLFGMVGVDFAFCKWYCNDWDKTVDEQLVFGHCVGKDIMSIIRLINKYKGVTFRSKDFFVRYFGPLAKVSKDVMDVVTFVKHQGTNVATGTEVLAVKNGIFSGMEAIKLISHEEESQISSAVSAESTQEPETDEDDLNPEEIPDIEVADPSLEAEGDDQPSEEDEDTSTDSDQGSDDSSSNNENDQGQENPEETGGEDDQGGDSSSGDDDSNSSDTVQIQNEPEDINTSDDEGIEIKFSGEGGDTVDTVLFREELDQFITDTLVNPPKKLSPQSVAALTTLQKCWVHILTVETVVRILDRIVAVPDKFKQILTNQESKKHE